MEDWTRIAIWAPYISLTLISFSVILTLTLRVIIASSKVRHSLSLLLLYLSLNINILCCGVETLQYLFPATEGVCSVFGTVEDATVSTMAFAALARVLKWLKKQSATRLLHRGMFVGCWLLLVLFAASVPVANTFTEAWQDAYFSWFYFTLFWASLVVFVMLLGEYRRTRRLESLTCTDRMLIAFFVCQMLGELATSLRLAATAAGLERWRSYELFFALFTVGNSTVMEICPSVLIFCIISADSSRMKKKENEDSSSNTSEVRLDDTEVE